ncbi:unnamed protein product, partial [Brassica oleracea]
MTAEEEAQPEESVNESVPTRLFTTDLFPSRRLNCFSSLEYLLVVRWRRFKHQSMVVVDMTCLKSSKYIR